MLGINGNVFFLQKKFAYKMKKMTFLPFCVVIVVNFVYEDFQMFKKMI